MTAFAEMLRAVKDADEDFEFYPTTDRMIDVVAHRIPIGAQSLLDIGAGDGRVLLSLAASRKIKELYAIEKSSVLLQAQPENIIPLGTDFFEQNLVCLPVDYIFCNPRYSEYELWAATIISSGHAKRAFLIIPQRWKESAVIAEALKKRGATARVLASDHFLDAIRSARAVVDILEIDYPTKGGYGDEVKDPFDIWFNQNVTTFDEEKDGPEDTNELIKNKKARQLDSIPEMVEAYNEERERMSANYHAIFQLDYELLKELGIKRDATREAIKAKMKGLKAKYWQVLFERLDVITNRLSTATKKKFLERLIGRAALEFTTNNAYAVVLWAIKNANQYFGEQAVSLFRELSTFDGVMNYKSNQRTWERNEWRYYRVDEESVRPSCYALDYRIVVKRYSAIYSNCDFGKYDYPGNLNKSCHELIADIIAVLRNLGFQSSGMRSTDLTWMSGQWHNWSFCDGTDRVLFQIKGYMNGNVHLRFHPDAIKTLNVEAGRLLGWLRSPKDVEDELGYTAEEAKRFYFSTKLIEPSNVRLLQA